jgi:hypothetical protein
MVYLLKLLNWLGRLLSNKNCDSNFIVQNGSVARFVFERRKIKSFDNSPKPGAFEPERHPNNNIFETSICGLNGVSDERLRKLGQTIRKDKVAIAAIEIKIEKIVEVSLKCNSAPELKSLYYPEHGVIVGWEEDKSLRLKLQQHLASNCTQTKIYTS